MCAKSIIFSSHGLKNILVKSNENDFRFINGKQEITIPRIFAEFLSPRVSHMHQCDPTINQLDFSDFLTTKNSSSTQIFNNILNENTKHFIEEIIQGNSVEIEEKEERTLRHLSVFLGNEEMFNKINENSKKVKSVDELIEDLILYEEISNSFIEFEMSKMIDIIAEYLSSNDQNKMKNLPRKIFYLIIKNKNFKRPDEDSLFDIVNEIINKTKEEENNEFKDIEMYEIVDLSKLSENKFKEFLNNFDFTEMTSTMWNKLCECFFINRKENKNKNKNENENEFEYDGNPMNRFSGIINHLRGGKNINIHDKGIISVTASSTEKPHYPKYAVDFDNDEYFHSDGKCDWLQYDFKNMKVRPTKYSIKTSNDHDDQFPVNWCIEVSNTGKTNDWRIIDSRENIQSVSKRNQSDTFEIKTQLSLNECYRYVRFRSTGHTSGNNNYNFVISSLEYFGTLVKNEK